MSWALLIKEILFAVLAILLVVLLVWQKRTYGYWKRLNVKHIKPTFFVGNCQDLLSGTKSLGEQIYQWYATDGMTNQKVVGVYLVQRPALLLRDLDLVRLVMIRKFQQIKNRTMRADPINDPLTVHNAYYARYGDWQALRDKLSPVFLNPKLRPMYALMVQIGKNLEGRLRCESPGNYVPIRQLSSRYVIDIIGSIGFGLEVKALQNERNEFYLQTLTFKRNTIRRSFSFAIMSLLPAMTQFATAQVLTEESTDIMRDTIDEKIQDRERTKEKRGDLIDTLVEMRREADAQPYEPNLAFEFDYLAGQAAMFRSNGFEPCAATITFALYELAMQPALLNRLRGEIARFFGREEQIAFERIQDMPYLNQVVNETLRKYPPHAFLERECSVQAHHGGRVSLAPYFNFVVPPGMPLYVSVLGIHRDSRYWHDPLRFNPERFSPQNKSRIVPDAFMPFGIGPRNCMGMRLAYLIIKVGLVHFLRNHRFSKCNKTVDIIYFEPLAPFLRAREEIYLRID